MKMATTCFQAVAVVVETLGSRLTGLQSRGNMRVPPELVEAPATCSPDKCVVRELMRRRLRFTEDDAAVLLLGDYGAVHAQHEVIPPWRGRLKKPCP